MRTISRIEKDEFEATLAHVYAVLENTRAENARFFAHLDRIRRENGK